MFRRHVTDVEDVKNISPELSGRGVVNTRAEGIKPDLTLVVCRAVTLDAIAVNEGFEVLIQFYGRELLMLLSLGRDY